MKLFDAMGQALLAIFGILFAAVVITGALALLINGSALQNCIIGFVAVFALFTALFYGDNTNGPS